MTSLEVVSQDISKMLDERRIPDRLYRDIDRVVRLSEILELTKIPVYSIPGKRHRADCFQCGAVNSILIYQSKHDTRRFRLYSCSTKNCLSHASSGRYAGFWGPIKKYCDCDDFEALLALAIFYQVPWKGLLPFQPILGPWISKLGSRPQAGLIRVLKKLQLWDGALS